MLQNASSMTRVTISAWEAVEEALVWRRRGGLSSGLSAIINPVSRGYSERGSMTSTSASTSRAA